VQKCIHTDLYIHTTRQELGIRIGIDCGEVAAGIIGKLQPRFHTHGAVMAHAQRLENQCMPGGVLISSRLAEMVPEVMGTLIGRSTCIRSVETGGHVGDTANVCRDSQEGSNTCFDRNDGTILDVDNDVLNARVAGSLRINQTNMQASNNDTRDMAAAASEGEECDPDLKTLVAEPEPDDFLRGSKVMSGASAHVTSNANARTRQITMINMTTSASKSDTDTRSDSNMSPNPNVSPARARPHWVERFLKRGSRGSADRRDGSSYKTSQEDYLAGASYVSSSEASMDAKAFTGAMCLLCVCGFMLVLHVP
jgi:hypothetical protein